MILIVCRKIFLQHFFPGATFKLPSFTLFDSTVAVLSSSWPLMKTWQGMVIIEQDFMMNANLNKKIETIPICNLLRSHLGSCGNPDTRNLTRRSSLDLVGIVLPLSFFSLSLVGIFWFTDETAAVPVSYTHLTLPTKRIV